MVETPRTLKYLAKADGPVDVEIIRKDLGYTTKFMGFMIKWLLNDGHITKEEIKNPRNKRKEREEITITDGGRRWLELYEASK